MERQEPLYAQSISQCPKLVSSSRRQQPTNIHDLRPDDIKAVAVIGDSISAGLAMENTKAECITNNEFIEYRGLSFDAGGDEGAITVPNFIDYYTLEKLAGSSIGKRQMPICPDSFFCTNASSDPSVDHFNAAIPSGTTRNMNQQIKYLIPKIGKNSPFANEWKVLTIELGMNDLAVSCMNGYTVFDFSERMKAGIQLIQESIDYVFINLIGLSHSEQEVKITDKHPGYQKKFCDDPSFDIQDKECYCCHISNGVGEAVVSSNVRLFNNALREIAAMYQPHSSNATFGVVYQPFFLKMDTLTYTAISNLDGFHPNIHLHQFFAKKLWNQMFLAKDDKDQEFNYDPNIPIRCPGKNDRFATR
ncbi:hypothetical protein INT45_008256 [Circinella minor]|uniref:Uncharacterized protein n=1 Tax=Circinella minor TaxID=1195481 RepID=A0A8H7VJP8_9FUNG|nr:hypothetical protein INT45_008256 [Circinella minor]